MTLKFATYCWLLVALAGTTTLAQPQPKKKSARKQAVIRRPITKSVAVESRERCYHVGPLLPPISDYMQADEVPECSKAYTYVEQMPTLNGQSAAMASSAAITQHLLLPSSAPAGRVFVKFEVTSEGRVAHPQILKGLRADVDSAVIAATRQLPHFTPGKQSGRVVTVSLTLPVSIPAKEQP